jgi:hypothetical protein
MPLPVVRSRVGHLQELTVECFLGDYVCLFRRPPLVLGVLDYAVAHQAHEANFLEVMHSHMVQNFPHGPLFDPTFRTSL